jgi:glycosyltransferase involved in cell wall biosynthesis
MQPVRLLVVSHFYAEHGGGIERVAAQMCQHLAAQGHTVRWAASARQAPSVPPGVAAVVMPCVNPTEALSGLPMPIPGPRAFGRMWRAVRGSDLVVIHDTLYCTSLLALLCAKIQRKPVMLIQHVAEIAFANPLLRLLMALANSVVTRPTLRTVDQVVFISDTVRAFFADCPTKRPPLLQFNGVDTAVFHPGAPERQALGLPEHGTLVAFVGRFVEKKGLSIVQAVAARCPGVCFALAGAGPIDPHAWGLGNVHVLGPLSPERIAGLFRSADCLLLPSIGEGYPLVIQEAMATGLPVICGAESARADPAAAPWLRGVPIDLQDIGASAAAIAALIGPCEPDARPDHSAMIAYAQKTYSWAGFAARLAEAGAAISPRG